MATAATGTTTLGQLKIPQPEKFQGKTNEWEEWHVLFKSFLATVNTRYKTLMDWAESMTEHIVDSDLKDYEELLPEGTIPDPQLTAVQLSRNLHHMLIGFTASPGPRVLVLQNDTANGFETWRRLHLRYSLPIPAKSAGALSALLRVKFNEKDFETSFDAWEHEIAKYERDVGTPLSDEVKIGVLLGATAGHLQTHLRLNTSMYTTYQSLRTVCLNYHKSRHAFGNHSNDVDMTDANNSINAVKGKGKGKGSHNWRSNSRNSKGKGKGTKDRFRSQSRNGKGKGERGRSSSNHSTHSTHSNWKGRNSKGGKGEKGRFRSPTPHYNKGKGSNSGYCQHCRKTGHYTNDCWYKDAMNVNNLQETNQLQQAPTTQNIQNLNNSNQMPIPRSSAPSVNSQTSGFQSVTPSNYSWSVNALSTLHQQAMSLNLVAASSRNLMLLADSGAMVHACPPNFAPECELTKTDAIVKAVDGARINVYGTKTVFFTFDTEDGDNLTFPITFVVIDINMIVISVPSLIREQNMTFSMNPRSYSMSKDGHTIPMKLEGNLPWLMPKTYTRNCKNSHSVMHVEANLNDSVNDSDFRCDHWITTNDRVIRVHVRPRTTVHDYAKAKDKPVEDNELLSTRLMRICIS